MKVVIGEYGKVIILALVLSGMVLFLFGKGEDGFLGMLASTGPAETIGNKDAFAAANAIASRALPELSVRVKKLRRGTEYNLLDRDLFEITAKNEDGENVELSIVRIIAPGEQDITAVTEPEHFTPGLQGEYRMTYRASEIYLGSEKAKEKEYRFIAD
ncbi:hypothetical protein DWX43_00930 [Clostridium sp. AF19-22AC]|uniref:hypothetical protein n=1 Tax=Clostridia TaxID=186801 RepID=UPI000E4DA139|nr:MULTISPECIES: hypothetical protein [Clostridia]RHR33015.1 hypothetical protein DWX43_00930 [Clostridium sp. AF19-22AC]